MSGVADVSRAADVSGAADVSRAADMSRAAEVSGAIEVNGTAQIDFYRRAGLVCRGIPYGKVATYGQIALLCGRPRHARQVGYGLNRGLLGEEIPAHRVVNARGILSGAAAFDTFDMQMRLLQMEGTEVFWTLEGWQVDLKKYGWKNTMEEAEEFRRQFLEMGI